MKTKAITRQWGPSRAVVIPQHIVKAQHLSANQEINLEVEPQRPKAGALFGFLKGWKRSTRAIKDEVRKGWESRSDRARNKV